MQLGKKSSKLGVCGEVARHDMRHRNEPSLLQPLGRGNEAGARFTGCEAEVDLGPRLQRSRAGGRPGQIALKHLDGEVTDEVPEGGTQCWFLLREITNDSFQNHSAACRRSTSRVALR